MKLIIKQLQGSECSVEVEPTTSILNIKKQIEKKMKIPVQSQRLLYLGRTLGDDQHVSSYPAIKEGTKLNLVVKKPESLYDVSLREYKRMGLSDAEAAKSANRLLTVIKEKFNQLSWDDLDRLCKDILMIKEGKRPPRVDTDATEDPSGL